MMKFFALVALAMFATTNASSVADGAITRGSTLLTGADGGSLIITFKVGTGTIVSGDVVKFTPVENAGTFFTTDDADCSCTATPAAITGVVGKPVKSSGILSMTLTTSGTIAATTEVVITCTANLAVNAAAGAKTFKLETSKDDTEVTIDPAYTVTSAVTAFSATRGTSYLTLEAPGSLVFKFTPTTQVAIGTAAVTLIASAEIFTANNPTTCTMAVASGTAPSSISTTVETKNTLKVTTVGQILLADVAVTVTCTSTTAAVNNMAVNTAAGDVTFSIATTGDIGPLAAQTGYTICAATGCPTSAASSTASVGMLTMLALAGVAMRQ